jgi:lipopolysaccharide/colanic/teichoic acid biosynthesis glycosyltransferase
MRDSIAHPDFSKKIDQTRRNIVNVRRSDKGSHLDALGISPASLAEQVVLNEQAFRRMISLERKRTERSGKPFLLVLLDTGKNLSSEKSGKVLENILTALSCSTRETDTVGWYEDRSVIGILFTEVGVGDRSAIPDILITRVSQALRDNLGVEQFDQVSLSCQLFPDDQDQSNEPRPGNPTFYPDIAARYQARKSMRVIKRLIDISGSLVALAFLSPLFLIIAIAIKVTSKGPVFFRQQRSGEFGITFSMLKFRSMYANSCSSTHKEYVRRLIAGVADKHPSGGDGRGVYKLTRDKRITSVGAFLRRTSLDELPQFINVLKGEMSLVGPRPPIDYEVEKYQLWHHRRLMEAKPGITGLWQVAGRNRIAFDDMVRLDLLYARNWSPWLDLKILLRTPKAVVEGAH